MGFYKSFYVDMIKLNNCVYELSISFNYDILFEDLLWFWKGCEGIKNLYFYLNVLELN